MVLAFEAGRNGLPQVQLQKLLEGLEARHGATTGLPSVAPTLLHLVLSEELPVSWPDNPDPAPHTVVTRAQ